MSDYFDSDADEASDTPAPVAETVPPAEDSLAAHDAQEDVTVAPVDGFSGTISVAVGEPVEISGKTAVPADVAKLLVETGKVEAV